MTGTVTKEVEAILDDPEQTDDEVQAYAKAYKEHAGDAEKRAELAKAAPQGSVSKMEFEITTEGSVGSVYKAGDDFVVWGPASVEVIDKENDRIKAEALEGALPQLLKRKRLSYEHSDQIVGDILERFKTEEPVEVEINGRTFERSEFPTDVLKLDGMNPALYVAGNIYNDTQKAQDVRKQIDEGEIDSYSISGEAVVTEMAVKDGQTFTDILKLDLSAVTLCREGMNQMAKFGVVSKDEVTDAGLNPQRAAKLAKSRITEKTMSDNDEDNDSEVEKFVDALDDTLDDRLPEGEIATKSDVEDMVDEKVDEKYKESPDRPSGDGDSGTETDEDYSGDNDANPAEESDKVEEKNAYSTEELKSLLPDDQFKAIAPHLERGEDPMEEIDPVEEDPAEMVPPEEEEAVPEEDPLGDDEEGMEDPVLAAEKSLDWDRLTEGQKKALAKGNLEKADNEARTSTGVGASAEPAHAGNQEAQDLENDILSKADNESVAGDPAMRKVYDEEGNPLI